MTDPFNVITQHIKELVEYAANMASPQDLMLNQSVMELMQHCGIEYKMKGYNSNDLL